ncbi:hypothetical protein FDF86_08470 [Clostridium botulinum]|nr:hypothetical protein [Clostridium botulinum]HBJ2621898.1 hypothetical protein [Clostridium botulinum]
MQKEGYKIEFSIGGLIDTVVGAVAKVETVIVNVLSPVAKSDGALGGIAGKIVGVAESVLGAIAEFGDACEEGNIDVDEDFEKILEEEFKLLVGAMLKEDWLRNPEGSMADFKNNINDLKNSDEVGNIIKKTDTFKWFKEKTQEGVLLDLILHMKTIMLKILFQLEL